MASAMRPDRSRSSTRSRIGAPVRLLRTTAPRLASRTHDRSRRSHSSLLPATPASSRSTASAWTRRPRSTRAATFYGTFDAPRRRRGRPASRRARGRRDCRRAAAWLRCAAAAAGIPSVVVANFTWDWIYREYEAFASRAGLIPLIQQAYTRPAPHGGCPSMAASRPFHDDRRRALRRAARAARAGRDARHPWLTATIGASRSFRSAATASQRWICGSLDCLTTGTS